MKRRIRRYRGMTSSNKGLHAFTISCLGNGNFHLSIDKVGQCYLLEGISKKLPENWNDDDVLHALFEIIDRKIFQGEFNYGSYRGGKSYDPDVPF
ncbi:MAG: hypothetical protein LCH83_13755 [Proteobacteria bacterium]|nr:hypothetical protein [Pseudomonadota bacterium]